MFLTIDMVMMDILPIATICLSVYAVVLFCVTIFEGE